jgi:hypothetical protein
LFWISTTKSQGSGSNKLEEDEELEDEDELDDELEDDDDEE